MRILIGQHGIDMKKKVTNVDKLSLYYRALKTLRELHPSYYRKVVKTDIETAYTIMNTRDIKIVKDTPDIKLYVTLYLHMKFPLDVLIFKREV